MVWYGMVNVDLYSAIMTKVSNALNTLVLETLDLRPFTRKTWTSRETRTILDFNQARDDGIAVASAERVLASHLHLGFVSPGPER